MRTRFARIPRSLRSLPPSQAKGAIGLVVGFTILALAAGHAHAALPAVVDGEPLPSLAPVLERVTPAVVNVNTQTRVQVRTSPFFDDPFFRRFFDFPSIPRERIQQSLGSGVIVDADNGYILTNNHVIEGAQDISVTLADERSYTAELVGSDRDTDLAVIRIDADDLAELPLAGSEPLRVGDFVVAVGNPFGLGQTVTSGIVSALGRTAVRGLEIQNFIQTDASINPGNSGGALINLRGELVGINTAIFTPSGGNVGIGFAIPATLSKKVMAQLIEFGELRRATLGLETQDMTEELAAAFDLEARRGAVVTRVRPDSAAESAGLRPGDVISRINGQDVRNAQDLRNAESLLTIGTRAEVEYLRDGRNRTTRIEVAEDLDTRVSGGRLDQRLEGINLARLPERSRTRGVLIERVAEDSNAWNKGLRANDLIVAVNRQRVNDLAEMRRYLQNAGDGELLLEIRRRGRGYLVAL